jgi:CHASE3 domain sensor protein
MDDIRSHVREMENQENELLKQQVAQAETSTRYTMLTLAIAIVPNFCDSLWNLFANLS